MAKVDWRHILFESQHKFGDKKAKLFEVLEKLASKRFPRDRTLAEEAFNAALEALTRDDFARLAGFGGRGDPRVYLIAVFRNALEDFARRRFGRPRPPAAIERRGGAWLDLYRSLIVERQPERDVIDALLARTDFRREDIQAMIEEVKALHRAPANPIRFVPFLDEADPESEGEAVPDPRPDPESWLLRWLDERAAKWLSRLFDRPTPRAADAGEADKTDTTSEKGETSGTPCGCLDDEDIVLLKGRHSHGLSLAACARKLGRPEHEVRRRHRQILEILLQKLRSGKLESSD